MKRRNFLQLALGSAVLKSLNIESVHGSPVPIESLRRAIGSGDGSVLVSTDTGYADYLGAFNKRTLLKPQVRVLARTPAAVQAALQWAQENQVPLALRAGGHSYEGFSQSKGLVIDTRQMNQIEMSSDASEFRAGAGALLGKIYETIAARGAVIPAGSCPTVGVTGHTTGGGYGLIARGFGLASDSLTNIEMVLADGRLVNANYNENPDLFWAMCGAGGGNFGIVTNLDFRTHRVKNVFTFIVSWETKTGEIPAALACAWQEWTQTLQHGINPLFKTYKNRKTGMLQTRVIGVSIGNEQTLRAQLAQLTNVAKGKVSIEKMPFLGSVDKFGGRETDEVTVTMKAKSNYLKRLWSKEEANEFFEHVRRTDVISIFDCYGGAIKNLKDSDTAFAHRENTIASVQHYLDWDPEKKSTEERLRHMRNFHDAIKPFFSGYAYSNYPDLDLKNYAEAYWAGNLDRLIQIKNVYDPKNVFRHAQSVPMRRS